MADVSDILGDDSSSEAYYVPSDDEFVIVSESTYPAHIVDLKVINTKIKSTGNACMIFKPVYQIADEAEEHQGRTVNSNGIFRYGGGTPGESNRTATSGNRAYKDFLDMVNVTPQEVKDENTGKVAYSLPLVTKDDIYGVPVMIKVKHRNYEYDGKLRTAADGILISVWGDGKAKQMDDDLPF